MKKLHESFIDAFRGLGYALHGRNFKIQSICGLIAILLSIFLRVSHGELVIIILVVGFVLSIEATNTVIEEICNKFHPETHPHIALIKDLSAGATLIATITSIIVGFIIFLPYFV